MRRRGALRDAVVTLAAGRFEVPDHLRQEDIPGNGERNAVGGNVWVGESS